MKKLLISILVAVMALSFGSMAFAAAGDIAEAPFTDIAGHQAEGDLTLLAALGVYEGSDGLARPDDPITRAEFCKVLVTAVGRGTTAKGLMGLQPTFSDGAAIPDWAWGYVNVAVYMGVINGYADGSFGPNNPVTYAEAVTMLIRAIPGHAAQVPAGVWPYNYLFYGVDGGFTGSVDVGFANLPATRGDVASLLVATMGVDKLNGDGEEMPNTAILANRVYGGVFDGYSGANAEITLKTTGSDIVLPCGDPVYLVGANAYNALLGVSVEAVLDAANGDCVFIRTTEATNVFSGVFAAYYDGSDADDVVDSYKFSDGTVIPFLDDETLVRVNGKDAAADAVGSELLAAGDECVVVLDEDGDASNVAALRFDHGPFYIVKVTPSDDVAETNAIIKCKDGTVTKNYQLPDTATIAVNGETIDRDELAAYDVVFVASTKGNGNYGPLNNPIYAVHAFRSDVEGTVAGSRATFGSGGAAYYLTIDETEYPVYDGGPIDVNALPAKGTKVHYALDGDGALFVGIDYELVTPFVVFRGYESGTDGAFMTVDMRGEEIVYATDFVSFDPDWVGEIGQITLDTASNKVTAFEPVEYNANHHYEILSVDAANGTMTVQKLFGDDGIIFANKADMVFYAWDSDTGAYEYVPLDQVDLDWDNVHKCNNTGWDAKVWFVPNEPL